MNSEQAEHDYHGKNYDYVMKNSKEDVKEMEKQFLKKYPNADMSKFEFYGNFDKNGNFIDAPIYFKNNEFTSTDIRSDTFLNDKSMTKYLYSHQQNTLAAKLFQKIFQSGGTIQPLPRGNKHEADYPINKKKYFWDEFPVEYVLNYPVNKFKIYVSNTEYFHSNLPEFDITINQQLRKTKQDKFDMSQHCSDSLVGAYIASYAYGMSIEYLTPSPDIPKQITSFLHFHIYFTIRRIMQELHYAVGEIVGKGDPHRVGNAVGINRSANNEARIRILQKYKADKLQRHFPDFHGRITDQKNNFNKFILKQSKGITSTGLILLNQSIQAYIYVIFGSQSKTRQSIVGSRGSVLETPNCFQKISRRCFCKLRCKHLDTKYEFSC